MARKSDEKRETFSVRLKPEVQVELKVLAAHEKKSISDYIGKAVQQFLSIDPSVRMKLEALAEKENKSISDLMGEAVDLLLKQKEADGADKE